MNIVEHVASELGPSVARELDAGRVTQGEFAVRTLGTDELLDVSDQANAVVRASRCVAGVALISVPHTTCALLVNEDEPGFRADLKAALERLAPRHGRFEHDLAPHDGEDEQPNGYAHVRAALLSSHSVLLPVRGGELGLGRWQRIFVLELDGARPRTVHVTVLGSADAVPPTAR